MFWQILTHFSVVLRIPEEFFCVSIDVKVSLFFICCLMVNLFHPLLLHLARDIKHHLDVFYLC